MVTHIKFEFFVCGLLAWIVLMASFSVANAQGASGFVDARNIPRAVASNSPVIGEVVMSEGGAVAPYFKKVQICNVQGCRVFIYDKRTGGLINNDGEWSPAYARTGVGQEVIRVKAFSNAERLRKKPASDQPLRSAPRIRVREVHQKKNE